MAQRRVLADLRLAVRHLRRAPGYAATAILTFALAIGANSAIFSAVNVVLLRPLPVDGPERVAVVWQTDAGGQGRHRADPPAHARVDRGRHDLHACQPDGIAQLERDPPGRGEPTRVWFNGVSASFFDTLGVAPFLGPHAAAGRRRAERRRPSRC